MNKYGIGKTFHCEFGNIQLLVALSQSDYKWLTLMT